MTEGHPSRAKIIAAYAAIYIIWGSTYLFIKYAIATIPSFSLGAARFTVAGLALFAWALLRSDVRPNALQWKHALIMGFLMLGIGNGAVVWAEHRVPSGITALIVAIVPLFVVLVDWIRPGGVRPHARVLIGVLIGLAGLAMLIGPGLTGGGEVDIMGALVLLFGSLTWSIGTVFGKHASVTKYPPLNSAMQLMSGALSLIVFSLVAGEHFQPSHIDTMGWISLLYLATFGSIIAFSAYSWLMRVSNPAMISTYAYVNPVVAMLLGWLFADERLSVRTLVAAAIVLAGVAMITLAPQKRA